MKREGGEGVDHTVQYDQQGGSISPQRFIFEIFHVCPLIPFHIFDPMHLQLTCLFHPDEQLYSTVCTLTCSNPLVGGVGKLKKNKLSSLDGGLRESLAFLTFSLI